MSTPFGPDDITRLDEKAAKAKGAELEARLKKLRAKMEDRLRQHRSPDDGRDQRDGRDGGQGKPHTPREKPPTRADQLWPFLMIRSFKGDIGARSKSTPVKVDNSPDVLLASIYSAISPEPVLKREDVTARQKLKTDDDKSRTHVWRGHVHEVWVHVWNLGRVAAHGVRVSAYLIDPSQPDATKQRTFLGGTTVDLGDRASPTSHLIVKAAQWEPKTQGNFMIEARAECMLDVAGGSDPDRHVARRPVGVAIMNI